MDLYKQLVEKKAKLSLVGLFGLLAFVTMPIYAQDVEVTADEENIVYDVENLALDTEDAVVEAEDIVAEDVAAENLDDSFEQFVAENPEIVSDLNAGLDEFLGVLEEENEGITDEFNAQFTTDEERAAAAFGFFAMFAGLLLIIGIVFLIWWLIKTIALWKAFKKA